MNNIFTIITPSLNQGRFIEQTIKSVLSQEGDFYIDYIIADGGSIDQTIEIIKKYDELLKTNQFPIKCNGISYHWWSKPDKGQSDALNQGFKIATGDILAWINSDDYYEPNTFEFILKKFRENPNIDLIYGDGYIIEENVSSVKKIARSATGNLQRLLEEDNFIFQPSAFFTKKIINEIGLLDEKFHFAMDYDLWIRIFKHGGQTLHFAKLLSNFRIWENSKSGSQQKQFLSDKKIISKKYNCNIVRQKTIYKMRNKILGINCFQKKYPLFYKQIKIIFYRFINKFKYKSKNQERTHKQTVSGKINHYCQLKLADFETIDNIRSTSTLKNLIKVLLIHRKIFKSYIKKENLSPDQIKKLRLVYTQRNWHLAKKLAPQRLKKIKNYAKEQLFYRQKSPLILNTTSLSTKTRNQLVIITIAFNNASVIAYQIKLLKKYLSDPHQHIIADNSDDDQQTRTILEICQQENISYIRLPRNPFTKSKSHGIAINWMHKNYIAKGKVSYFGFIDHDIFPIKKTSIIDHLQNQPVYGLLQKREKIWYLWAGFSFFKSDKIPKTINFSSGVAKGVKVDTGGMNWNNLYSKLDLNKINFPEHSYQNIRNTNGTTQSDKIEFIGDWLHLFNSSNWMEIPKQTERDLILRKILDNALQK